MLLFDLANLDMNLDKLSKLKELEKLREMELKELDMNLDKLSKVQMM